jgi:hypothetical protein
VAASESIRQIAKTLPIDLQLRCDQPGCGKSSPVLHWHLEGQVAELAQASEEALAELSRRSPALKERLEARRMSDNARAAAFLATWAEKNIRPLPGDFEAELSRLLAKLLTAWYHSAIPGPALLRAAGGDLSRFVEQARANLACTHPRVASPPE